MVCRVMVQCTQWLVRGPGTMGSVNRAVGTDDTVPSHSTVPYHCTSRNQIPACNLRKIWKITIFKGIKGKSL